MLPYFLVSAEQVALLRLMLQPLLQLGDLSLLFLQLVVQTLACFCLRTFKRGLKEHKVRILSTVICLERKKNPGINSVYLDCLEVCQKQILSPLLA